MKNISKFAVLGIASIIILILSVAIGSVFIPFDSVIKIIFHKIFSIPLDHSIKAKTISTVWAVRVPRILGSFLVGAALSMSGAVMQSVLQNPLASSYTLGVSSGAAVGVAVIMTTGFAYLGAFTLPIVGFLCGFATVVVVIAVSSRLDKNLQNQTIILLGMILSLFLNAVMTLISALNRESIERMVLWQMGGLSGVKWREVAILSVVTVAGFILLCFFFREMDIMTFGETQSQAMGVNVKNVKWILLLTVSLLTGVAVCFTGVIGFVDLVSPHLMRRIFGSKHKLLVPASAIFGGAFLALADSVARTLFASSTISVGVVTAVIGAPFFAYVFFRSRGKVQA